MRCSLLKAPTSRACGRCRCWMLAPVFPGCHCSCLQQPVSRITRSTRPLLYRAWVARRIYLRVLSRCSHPVFRPTLQALRATLAEWSRYSPGVVTPGRHGHRRSVPVSPGLPLQLSRPQRRQAAAREGRLRESGSALLRPLFRRAPPSYSVSVPAQAFAPGCLARRIRPGLMSGVRPIVRSGRCLSLFGARHFRGACRYLASRAGRVDLSPQFGYCDTGRALRPVGWRLRLFRVLKELQRC